LLFSLVFFFFADAAAVGRLRGERGIVGVSWREGIIHRSLERGHRGRVGKES